MKTNYIQIRADEELKEAVNKLADLYGLTVSATVTMLIKKEVKRIDSKVFSQNVESPDQSYLYLSTERDVLFGRLFAIAQFADYYCIDTTSNKRGVLPETMLRDAAIRPSDTWESAYLKIRPILNKMPKEKREYLDILINDIFDKFEKEDFASNAPLTTGFIHAFTLQLKELGIVER